MKSQIQTLQENNFKSLSKNLLFTLAIAALSFTNVAFAGRVENSKFKIILTEDPIVTAPATLIDARASQTIEEVIAEDLRITESVIEQAQPCSGKTMIEIIEEDNKIIESNIASEQVYLLNFKKINKAVNFPKPSRTLAGS